MKHIKVDTLNRNELAQIIELGGFNSEARIVTRYKEESDGIILLATNETLMDMIDDTCPEDAVFEIYGPVIEEDDE